MCWCKGTWFWRQKKSYAADIAILTGGEVISDEVGLDLKETLLPVRPCRSCCTKGKHNNS